MKTYNDVRQLQALPYEIKTTMSKRRIHEFVQYYGESSVVVSYSGGLDSTFALHFIRQLYPKIRAVSVLGIECKANIDLIRKTENVTPVPPAMAQNQVIETFGYPVVSKKAAKNLEALQNPTDKNANIRNLALTGITQAGKTAKTYMLAKKWRFLIKAPFKISNKCCYYMKETAVQKYCKKNQLACIVATMAEESKSRMDGYCKRESCNSFKGTGDSVPFAFWTRQDILRYIVENNVEISKAYGEIKKGDDGNYFTTKASRTGCPICMFGMEHDKEPNRFQIMYYEEPKQWHRAIFEMGYKQVLDFFIANGFDNYQYYPREILNEQEVRK